MLTKLKTPANDCKTISLAQYFMILKSKTLFFEDVISFETIDH